MHEHWTFRGIPKKQTYDIETLIEKISERNNEGRKSLQRIINILEDDSGAESNRFDTYLLRSRFSVKVESAGQFAADIAKRSLAVSSLRKLSQSGIDVVELYPDRDLYKQLDDLVDELLLKVTMPTTKVSREPSV